MDTQAQEHTEFVIRELAQHHRRDDIILALCEWGGLRGDEAAEFVRRVESEQADAIRAWERLSPAEFVRRVESEQAAASRAWERQYPPVRSAPFRDWLDPTRLYNPARPAGRLEYAWGNFFYPLGVTVLLVLEDTVARAVLGNLEASALLDLALLLQTLIVALFWILGAVAGILIGIRRLKDLDKSGWYMLWAFVPCAAAILGLYLLFAPGVAPSRGRL